MALIKTKQVFGLDSALAAKLEASDLNALENSVDSLEASVNALQVQTASAATDAEMTAVENSIDSLEDSVNAIESDIADIIARENYGAEDVTGLTAVANNPLVVSFTPGRFAASPYDYEVYVNGIKTIQAWVTVEFDGTNVTLTLPYDVEESDVFTIKAIELIP